MKSTFLFAVAITVAAGVYFLYDAKFVFQFMFEDGIFRTNYSPLGLPLTLFALAAIFYGLYRQAIKSIRHGELQSA